MANYAIDPKILKPNVPHHTELDAYNGIFYVSLVGFLFQNTRVRGLSFPFHRNFEEVNLRFYVRYKEGSQWKRGVVFMKEIVPRRMISFIANTIYNEKYATHAMRHKWITTDAGFHVEYYWKTGPEWNWIKAVANKDPQPVPEGSKEEFITEHYYGYTYINPASTGVYEVAHPQWRIHPVKEFDIKCNAARLYGHVFAEPLSAMPQSVFLAEGSPIQVLSRTKLLK